MNIKQIKSLLSPLKMLGINIDNLVPELAKQINKESVKHGAKIFLMISANEFNQVEARLYKQCSEAGLKYISSALITDIESIFKIFEKPENEPTDNSRQITGHEPATSEPGAMDSRPASEPATDAGTGEPVTAEQ